LLSLAGKHRGSKATVIKVPHAQEILTFLNSRAVTLEATVNSSQRQFLGAGRKEEVLNQAAHLHLQLGNIERYGYDSRLPLWALLPAQHMHL
jgi:hypothetical protein